MLGLWACAAALTCFALVVQPAAGAVGREVLVNGHFETVANPNDASTSWRATGWNLFEGGYRVGDRMGLVSSTGIPTRAALMTASSTTVYRAAQQSLIFTPADGVNAFTISGSAAVRAFRSQAGTSTIDVYVDVVLNTGPAWGAVVHNLKPQLSNTAGGYVLNTWRSFERSYTAPAGATIVAIYVHLRSIGINGDVVFDGMSVMVPTEELADSWLKNGQFEIVSNPTAAMTSRKATHWNDFMTGYYVADGLGRAQTRCGMLDSPNTSTFRGIQQTVTFTAADNVRTFEVKASAIATRYASMLATGFLDMYVDVILNTGPHWAAILVNLRSELSSSAGGLTTGQWRNVARTYNAPSGTHVTSVFVHFRLNGINAAVCVDDVSVSPTQQSMTGRQLVSNGGFEVISNPTAAVSQWKAQSWSDFASGYQAAQSGGLGNSRCALMEASDTSTYRAAHQTVVLTAADNVRQFTIKASAIMRAFSSAAAGAFLDVYLDVILNTGPAWGAVVLDLRKELANANGQLRTGSWVTATGTYSAPAGSHVTNIYIHPRMRGIQGAACFDDISIQLEEASCLQFSNCNGHGTCEAGECKCQSGYVAPFCCPPNRTGKDCSQCAPGYFGSSCTKCSDAHTTCNGHGTCDDGLSGTGRCKCSSSRFTGEFCQLCGTGFYGPDCLACSDCSGHGTCGSSGACECTSPYSGANCEIACSGHGTVAGTGCNCQSGWTGTTCQQISAPTMKLSYTEDMSIFPNPMRGWYRSRPVYMALPDYARGTLHDMTCAAWFNCPWDHRYCCHVLDPNELRTSRNSRDAMSVVYRGYYMAGPPQHSDTIDPAILALMRADLRAARAAGFTVVWRIAYSSTDNIPVLMQAHGTVGTDVPLDRALRHIDHITREVLRRGDYFTADSSSLIYLNNPSCVPDPTNAGGYLGSSYYGSVTQVTDCDPKHDPGIDISSPSTNWAITDLEVARQKQSGVFPRLLAPLDDVVGVIQLGVGGAWGEFHRSSGALIGSPNAALLAQRLHTAFNPSASAHQREVCSAAERRSFPIACASAAAKAGDVRAVSMRTPGIQRFVVGDGLTGDQFAGSTNANDPAYGFFDDCFVANSHHMGTFGVTGMVCRPGSQSRNTASTRMSTSNAAFKQECFGPWDVDDWTWATIHGCCPMSTGEAAVNNDIAYLTDVLARPPQRPYGGETCAFNWPVSGCQNTLASLQRFRVTYLNLDYNVDVIGQWKWEGCYEEVTRRMGYRLVLVSAELPGAMYADSANAGSVITITMRNVGFAAPIFSRVPFLIMHRRSDGLRFATPVFQDTAATKYEDIRYWMPGQLITIKALMRLDKVPPGSYDLRLWIPDVHAHKRLRPEYSIRFANPNVWNAATGDNTIASNLQVLAGGGGGTSSEGSAFEQLQSLQRRLQEQQDVVVDEQGRVVNMTGRVLLDREPQRVAFAGVAAFDKEPLGYIEVMPLVRSGDLWYYANCTADRFHGMVPYYMPAYDHNHWDVGASPLGRCNASVCKPNADHPIGTHLDFTSEGPGFQNPFIMKHLGCFGEYNWWDTVTLYARKQFQTEVPCDWSSACLLNVTGRIVHTGGAVVRVNGIEVYRHLVVAGRDLPANAPANGTATQATPVEAYFQVPNSAVRCGTNLMAVEVRSGQRGEAAWDDVLMDVDLVHSVHRSCRNSRSGYGGNYTEDFTVEGDVYVHPLKDRVRLFMGVGIAVGMLAIAAAVIVMARVYYKRRQAVKAARRPRVRPRRESEYAQVEGTSAPALPSGGELPAPGQ